jgi:TonB family protein
MVQTVNRFSLEVLKMPGRFHGPRRLLTAIALLVLLGFLGHALPAISQEAPRADGPPYRVGDGVTRPELVTSIHPVYTELARRARVTGTVILEAIIDEQGDVQNVRVLKGLPMGLDQAATDAVKMWKFKPATLKGQPVRVYYVLTVNFQVDGDLFGSGPTLARFLKENPELETQLRGGRYPEARLETGRGQGAARRQARRRDRAGPPGRDGRAGREPRRGRRAPHQELAAPVEGRADE